MPPVLGWSVLAEPAPLEKPQLKAAQGLHSPAASRQRSETGFWGHLGPLAGGHRHHPRGHRVGVGGP